MPPCPGCRSALTNSGISAEQLREGVAIVLDYVRRRRALHDPEYEVFTKGWMDGDREVQQGYLPNLRGPTGTSCSRSAFTW